MIGYAPASIIATASENERIPPAAFTFPPNRSATRDIAFTASTLALPTINIPALHYLDQILWRFSHTQLHLQM
mgnify:CR=1 FL=1